MIEQFDLLFIIYLLLSSAQKMLKTSIIFSTGYVTLYQTFFEQKDN